MLAVDARDLTKTFRSGWFGRRRKEALRGASLQVPRGAIFGRALHGRATTVARLSAALAALQPGYGAIAVLPVHPAPDKPAIRIILRAIKGSRAPLAILPGFVLNEAANCPSAMADAVLRGARALPLAQTAT